MSSKDLLSLQKAPWQRLQRMCLSQLPTSWEVVPSLVTVSVTQETASRISYPVWYDTRGHDFMTRECSHFSYQQQTHHTTWLGVYDSGI